MTREELFALADHIEHPGMSVDVEVKSFSASAVLRCSCGSRIDVTDEQLADLCPP